MDVVSLWPLTARAAELEVFGRVWGTARGRSVVVFGSAGVGKTRLAEEFLRRAAPGGVPRVRATASAAAARVPLGAIAHLLPAGVDLADPVRGFAQVASVLGGSGPARVVMVDDLHWLDAASAILLRQLLDAGSIRLIGTVRAGEPVNEAVELLCADDAVCRIDLAAFSLPQVEQVVRAALGGVVGRQTVRRLHDSSGGNALYLRELVSGALAAGALASDGEIWELAEGRMAGTPRLVELIDARLRSAGPQGRAVLELLALCEPVPLADAEAVAGMDALVDLEAAGLIRTRTDRLGTELSLAHPLYAEVIRADIAPLRRRRLLLEQTGRARADGAAHGLDTRRIAAWQLEATGQAEPALLIEAAALARHAHDYVQARDLLQALAEDDHTTSTRVMLGEALWQLGDAVKADAVLAAAASAATDEYEFLAVTMTRAANRFWGEGDRRGTFELFEAARDRVTDPACLKSLRHVEGTMRISAGDPRRGLALLEDLAEEVEGAGDPVAWLNAASAIPAGLSHVGRTAEAMAWAERAHRVHLGIADKVLFAHPASQLISGVVALTAAGRLAQARETAEAAGAELAEAHAPAIRVWMIVYLGCLELLAGRVADARRWFAEVAALARGLSRTSAMNLALVGLALSAALLGDVDAAELAAAEANAHPIQPAFGHWNALAEAWLHVAHRRDPREARSLLADAAERARDSGLLLGEALLLADLARLGGAAQAAPRLAEIAEFFDGALIPALAHLAAALAADEPAPLLAAAGELAALGADLMAAEAATAAGAAYTRSGDPRRAAAAAQDARRHLERCGQDHPRTPLLQVSQATASLTEREREIAQMAAHGIPSREIAETLHVSVRTVQNHLQRAYTKLGVTNRGELTRALR
ncbi:AAA family ATPase [Actinospica durhamensis]|uniref:AAA family ATPase n=1 Tax=Actinospica durhamensis TaxID=1508375 RepID=A0A941EX05_9ACTN|nr:LuxR family transcriptional regulator [Actinospica durhamensis]MBR7838801.1 AAA family ATPase [Actinospica durhamensis]